MDVTEVGDSLAIEDEGTIVEIDEVNGEPAWFGGTLVSTDPETGEETWEGRQRVTITQCGLNSKRYKKVEAWQQKEFRRIGHELAGDGVVRVAPVDQAGHGGADGDDHRGRPVRQMRTAGARRRISLLFRATSASRRCDT